MPDEITPTPAPVAAPVVPEVSPEQLRSISAKNRDAILFGTIGKSAENPEPAPKPVVPAPEAAVVVPPVEPAAEVVPPVDAVEVPPVDPLEPKDEDFTKSFRLHTTDKKQSAFLKAYRAALEVNPNVNPADIARSVGLEAPVAQERQIPGINQPAPQPPAEIVNARTEIAALEARIDEAVKDGVLTTPEIAKLQREYADKRANLSSTELRYEIAAANQQAQQSANQQARAQAETERQMGEVLAAFPTANDSNSILGSEVDRLFLQLASDPNHPDRLQFHQPDGRKWLVQQAADNAKERLMKTLGLTEAQAEAAVKGTKPEAKGPVAAPTPKPNAIPPVPRTVLVTGKGGQPAPAPTQLTPQQVREMVRNNPKLRDAALGIGGKRRVA